MITDVGFDMICKQISDTAAQPAAANRIALTANATAPAAGDTTLTAEITTAGGGLIRAQAVFAKTSTKVYTLTKTFTANGSDSLPVTINKIGIFNAASSGTMAFETLVPSPPTLSVVGDAVTITETVTLS